MHSNVALFLRIPDGTLTEGELEELCQRFQTVFSGLLDGLVDDAGLLFHIDAVRERLDRITWKAEVAFNDDDLIFWTRLPIGHWYDFRYASGDSFPLVLLASWWLEARVPQGEVYYGQDMPDGVGRVLTDPAKGALMYHFCRYGKAWYHHVCRSEPGLKRSSAPAGDQRREMADAYQEDFGSPSFEGEDIESSWSNFNWRGLAFRLAQARKTQTSQVEWDFTVPKLKREDLEALLTSYHPVNRIRGIEMAGELGGLSAGELKPVLKPLFQSDRHPVLMGLLQNEDLFDSLPVETKQEVLAKSLASEAPAIRRMAFPLAGRVGSGAPTR